MTKKEKENIIEAGLAAAHSYLAVFRYFLNENDGDIGLAAMLTRDMFIAMVSGRKKDTEKDSENTITINPFFGPGGA